MNNTYNFFIQENGLTNPGANIVRWSNIHWYPTDETQIRRYRSELNLDGFAVGPRPKPNRYYLSKDMIEVIDKIYSEDENYLGVFLSFGYSKNGNLHIIISKGTKKEIETGVYLTQDEDSTKFFTKNPSDNLSPNAIIATSQDAYGINYPIPTERPTIAFATSSIGYELQNYTFFEAKDIDRNKIINYEKNFKIRFGKHAVRAYFIGKTSFLNWGANNSAEVEKVGVFLNFGIYNLQYTLCITHLNQNRNMFVEDATQILCPINEDLSSDTTPPNGVPLVPHP